jgi:ribonuclease HI
MKLFCDGACNPNPGPMGIGVAMIDDDGKLVGSISRALGDGTNNVAEFEAVLAALELARNRGIFSPDIFTDSRLVVEQIAGRYIVSAQHLRALRDRAARDVESLEAMLAWIPREENTLADRLSKRALAPDVLPSLDVVTAQFGRVKQFLGSENAMRDVTLAVLEHLENEPELAEEVLLAARFGYNGKDTEQIARFNARVRHGEEAVSEMESAVAQRSATTRLKALRWAGRGFPPALVAVKLALEKALSAPFERRAAKAGESSNVDG